MIDRPHTALRARIARRLYQRAKWPFRATFRLLERVRCRGTPRRLTTDDSNGHLAANAEKSLRERSGYGYDRAFDLVSQLRPSGPPGSLQVLSIGPRSEIELYYLWLFFGFSWKHLVGVDLVSASPKIRIADIGGTLPFPDNHFDVVLAAHCLEKSLDPERTKQEIRRVAKPGAYVMVAGSVPLNGALTPVASPVPVHMFPRGVYGLIRLYGLRLQDIEYMNARIPHGRAEQFHIIFRVIK